jgi:16S rRNA C1402 (ribose-2'-O) methylase RsmI
MNHLSIDLASTLNVLKDMQAFASERDQVVVANELDKLIRHAMSETTLELALSEISKFAFHWKGPEDVYFDGQEKQDWTKLLEKLRCIIGQKETTIATWFRNFFSGT